jgi:hypothetical protein
LDELDVKTKSLKNFEVLKFWKKGLQSKPFIF